MGVLTETGILGEFTPEDKHYDKAQYCLKNRMSLIDFDEWCYICEVLNRDIPFDDVSLMNKYVLEYNDAHGTDYDWDWMDYPLDDGTRTLFEDMIAFGYEKEM